MSRLLSVTNFASAHCVELFRMHQLALCRWLVFFFKVIPLRYVDTRSILVVLCWRRHVLVECWRGWRGASWFVWKNCFFFLFFLLYMNVFLRCWEKNSDFQPEFVESDCDGGKAHRVSYTHLNLPLRGDYIDSFNSSLLAQPQTIIIKNNKQKIREWYRQSQK